MPKDYYMVNIDYRYEIMKYTKGKKKTNKNKKGWNTISIYNINQNKGWPAN